MPLNLNNGGDFTPHIRWMASTSTWQMSSENGLVQFDLTQAIMDFENIRTGWAVFAEAQAPEWVFDPSLTQAAPKPQDGREWKRGFNVQVFSKNLFGDEPIREFATNTTGAVMGIDLVYNQFEQELSNNQGKVPVVEYTGAQHAKVGKGNTNVPQLKIVKWVDRPAELSAGEQVTQTPAPTAAQTQPQATGAVNEF